MDLIGWLWVLLKTAIWLVWSVLWFLLGGWVSTLAQIVVLVGIVFTYKYGWQRAPVELMTRGRAFARFAWGWVRARDVAYEAPAAAPRGQIRSRPARREAGDVHINVSTVLSVAALLGLGLIAAT